jgi:hypothetical protein
MIMQLHPKPGEIYQSIGKGWRIEEGVQIQVGEKFLIQQVGKYVLDLVTISGQVGILPAAFFSGQDFQLVSE